MKIWFKQKTRPRMNSEWIEKTIKKKIRSKNLDPKIKNQSEIAAREQKITSKTANCCSNNVFSLFKIGVKKFHDAKPLAFPLDFLFRRDQNHYSNLNSKIMKMCEQIFKKVSTPIQFKFFEL